MNLNTCKIDDFRAYVANKLGMDGEGFSIWLEIFGTLGFTLVFFLIFGGNSIIGFIFSWIIWEFMIFSICPENYKIFRRVVIIVASVLLFILLEQSAKYIRKIRKSNKNDFKVSPYRKYYDL